MILSLCDSRSCSAFQITPHIYENKSQACERSNISDRETFLHSREKVEQAYYRIYDKIRIHKITYVRFSILL